MGRPETRYAKTADGVHIAYQVVGSGPLDLVYVPGWVSNIDEMWEEPMYARFLERLASFSRLILFDKRGTGLSDAVPLADLPTLEQRMDDVRAVMDTVRSERAALLGHSEGGNMSVLFAATYPERTAGLVTIGCYAARIWSPDYPWAPTPEAREREYADTERTWGSEVDLDYYAPSMAGDDAFAKRLATYLRRSASPQASVALLRMNSQIDVRSVLPTVRVPTLVMNRVDDRDVSVEEARYMAARIPGAKLVELSGGDHLMWVGDTETLLGEVEEFLTGVRRGPEPDRVLATVVFTDIVGSTEAAVRMGDRSWGDLLERHHATVRRLLAQYRGTEMDTAGDGFFATFDGPARAVRCAQGIIEAVRELDLEVRAGIHTGEVEVIDGKIGGIAVNIGARVAASAGASQVLVSQTVKDLVAGSGLAFEDAGEHDLKGVPGRWRLYLVAR
jgi:pimeloyl-ACP methyl ester carboxylesterase